MTEKYAEFTEHLTQFTKLEQLRIPAPFLSHDILTQLAQLLIEKRQLKEVEIDFQHEFWIDWTISDQIETKLYD